MSGTEPMSVDLSFAAFAAGAVVSLASSWVLVSRLERVGERLGFSEALLGMLAALAADAPEITSSVTALSNHQRTIGAGVVIGSNVFNLAALLGLGAIVAGSIRLHRKVVVLGGSVAIWVAIVCLLAVLGVISVAVALILVLLVVVPYLFLLSGERAKLGRLPIPSSWATWLTSAVNEEELELDVAIRPPRGQPSDSVEAVVALIVVVGASVAMERGASTLGTHYAVAPIVIGGLVLAAVTSLPNAVAAIYLSGKGRGAAALSTAFNSNTFNVLAGLLIPATAIGLARPSGTGALVVGWYVGLTAITLILAYIGHGLRRWAGWLIVASYAVFVVLLTLVS
jgi:cation:H+ antiporter